jgi:hypothetical protein
MLPSKPNLAQGGLLPRFINICNKEAKSLLVDETMRRGAAVDNGDGYELTSIISKV